VFLSNGDTYDRFITDPETEEKKRVTLRPLMAGDRADIQDQLRIQIADSDDDDDDGADANTNVLQLRPGTNRLMSVAAALVSWELEVAPTLSAVRSLHPAVVDQIFAEISWGKIPAEPSKEELAGDPLLVSSDSSRSDGREPAAELS
jgi:hypothetical protein